MNKGENQKTENKRMTSDFSITRKEALDKMGKAAKKLAVASLPFIAVAGFTEKAQAVDLKLKIVRILNIFLQMEFMLELYYLIPVLDDELAPPPYSRSIDRIKVHHQYHALNIKGIIRRIKSPKKAAPQISCNFDTDNLNPGRSFDDFLQIAQVLEDASTSLYKKYIPELRELGLRDVLQRTMLRTHTAEARHAAYIRLIRNQRGLEEITPWISSTTNNAVLSSIQNVYLNEDNTSQAEIEVRSVTTVLPEVIREAWDEPCNDDAINNLFKLFKAQY